MGVIMESKFVVGMTLRIKGNSPIAPHRFKIGELVTVIITHYEEPVVSNGRFEETVYDHEVEAFGAELAY
jgi:hypothetical protein